MTLAAMIRKRPPGTIATAIPAIPAISREQSTGTVARIATIAVANGASVQDASRQEFERLLAIVGPAYRTPATEYAEMREAARGDLENALVAYRELAKQISEGPHQ